MQEQRPVARGERSLVADAADREDRVVEHDVAVVRHETGGEKVLPGDDPQHAGARDRSGLVDARDRGVRARRAGRDGVDHSGHREIDRVARGTGHLRDAVGAGSRRSGDAPRRGQALLRRAPRRRVGDRLDDRFVSGAAADVAFHEVPYRRRVRLRTLVEQRLCRDDHPRRAVAALEREPVDEGLLQRMQLRSAAGPCARVSESLDRHDAAAVSLDRERGAGADRSPIEEHRAHPAHLHVAAELRAHQAEPADHFDEQKGILDRDPPIDAVEPDADLALAHQAASATSDAIARRVNTPTSSRL